MVVGNVQVPKLHKENSVTGLKETSGGFFFSYFFYPLFSTPSDLCCISPTLWRRQFTHCLRLPRSSFLDETVQTETRDRFVQTIYCRYVYCIDILLVIVLGVFLRSYILS